MSDKGVTKCDTLDGTQDLTVVNRAYMVSLQFKSKGEKKMKLSRRKVELELVRQKKTWDELARGIGVTKVNVYHLFKVKSNNLTTIINICRFLKVDVLNVVEDEKS